MAPLVKHGMPNSTSCSLTLPADPNIRIMMLEDMGRGLFWYPADGRTILKGTTLLRLEPEMIVPYGMRALSMCHVCFSDNKATLKRCTGCELIRYCSTACKEADYDLHEIECKALKERNRKFFQIHGKKPLDQGLLSGIIRLSARLSWQRARLGEEWWKAIDDLSWHQIIILDQQEANYATRLASYLRDAEQPNRPSILGRFGLYQYQELQEKRDILSRVSDNAFEVKKQNGQPVGHALSTVAALINHSCDANASIEYPQGLSIKKCMHIIARKDIKPGEQLTISYVSDNGIYPVQVENIDRLMCFQCKCSVCKNKNKSESKN